MKPHENKIIARLAKFRDAVIDGGEITKVFTCRTRVLELETVELQPEQIVSIRKLLGVSQGLFAKFLGVSPRTVSSWEQGASQPSEMACRFMDEIRTNIDYWRNRLRQVTKVRSTAATRLVRK